MERRTFHDEGDVARLFSDEVLRQTGDVAGVGPSHIANHQRVDSRMRMFRPGAGARLEGQKITSRSPTRYRCLIGDIDISTVGCTRIGRKRVKIG